MCGIFECLLGENLLEMAVLKLSEFPFDTVFFFLQNKILSFHSKQFSWQKKSSFMQVGRRKTLIKTYLNALIFIAFQKERFGQKVPLNDICTMVLATQKIQPKCAL